MQPSDSEQSFVALKFKVYQRGVLLGALITTIFLLVLWIGKIPLQIDDLIIPFMAVFCFASSLLFKKLGTRFLRPFELIIFIIVYIYYLADFAYLILQGLHLPMLDFRNFELWLPLIYILAFLIFRSKHALFISMLFLTFIFVAGLAYFFSNLGQSIDWRNISFLIQLYASNALYLTLLYIIALLKDRYGESEIRSKQMTHFAMIDDLTSVHNRRKINDLFNVLFQDYKDHGRPFSIIMLDIDGFKKINDAYGHDVGDYVLRGVADVLRLNVREMDQIGRWGGDEFLIFYPNTTDEQISLLAKRLTSAIRKADFRQVGRVTLSLGVATSMPDDTTESLSKRADKALYIAKQEKALRNKR